MIYESAFSYVITFSVSIGRPVTCLSYCLWACSDKLVGNVGVFQCKIRPTTGFKAHLELFQRAYLVFGPRHLSRIVGHKGHT